MIKKKNIPTILGILLLLGGVFTGVILLKNNQLFRIGASSTAAPKDVRVSSVSDSTATITWVTGEPTSAFISYGTDENTGTVINETENDQKYTTHSITITGLSASSTYYLKINSNGTTFDNNGVPWQFITGENLPLSQKSIPISGSVISASGTSMKRAIVYITINGYVISTMTSENGTFVLQIGSARTPDLSAYADIDLEKTLLEISVTAETGETAIAKIFSQSANPIPALIIGQDQDFRNLEPLSNGLNPDANLSLPESATAESKLDVSQSETISTTTLTLDSITEGEVITSNQPQLFGDGPKGTEITITIHSDTEISGSAVVSSSGLWNWSLPTDLSPGAHTITISWIDSLGIARTLTRNFIVQAGELPAFEASPSGTPTTTPKPSQTPSPTPIPSATKTPLATKSPTPKPTAIPTTTPESLPESGILTPTLLLSMMGIGVITFAFYIWKKSEDES